MAARSTVILAALLCFFLAAGAAGCGSESSTGPGQVVEDFWGSVWRGDAGAAYDLFSWADRQELSYEDFREMVDESAAAAREAEARGQDYLIAEPEERRYEVEIVSERTDGDFATVSASYGGESLEFELVREDGAWKLDGIAETLQRASRRAAAGECADNIRTIESAIMVYNATNGVYPQTIEELVPEYIKEMPVCPEGGTYTMSVSGDFPEVTCSVHASR